MSLHEQLKSIILSKGILTYGDAVNLCLQEGYKSSNMERRMRELCQGAGAEIEPMMARSKRNTEYISGWRRKKEKIDAYEAAGQKFAEDYFRMVNQMSGIVAHINSLPAHSPKAEQKQESLFK
jgi:hypothetical protein